jgi:hypothetical protein
MSVNSSRPSATTRSVVIPLLPVIAVVFIAFLVIGLALPVLPLHVHQGLGLGAFVVGLVAGAQFGASIAFRALWCFAIRDESQLWTFPNNCFTSYSSAQCQDPSLQERICSKATPRPVYVIGSDTCGSPT